MSPRRTVLAFCLALIAAPLLTLAALQRDAPLLLNLGPGDEAFARGLRGGWERDGLLQEGATTFRWSLDGSRLEFPLIVSGENVRARIRLARFVDTPVDVVLKVNGREADRWRQDPSGWTLRETNLGNARGPLQIQLRSEEPEGGEGLGIALDWVEVVGLDRATPRVELLPGLALLFVGVPLLIAIVHSLSLGLGAATLLSLIGPVVLGLDKLGGLVALSRSGLPLVGSVLLLKLAAAAVGWLARRRDAGAVSSVLPLVFAGLALLALHQPFYYYPDVTSHVHALRSIREEPRLTLDPVLQKQRGLHTREVAGRKVVFPYSTGFHLLATPLTGVLEETSALKDPRRRRRQREWLDRLWPRPGARLERRNRHRGSGPVPDTARRDLAADAGPLPDAARAAPRARAAALPHRTLGPPRHTASRHGAGRIGRVAADRLHGLARLRSGHRSRLGRARTREGRPPRAIPPRFCMVVIRGSPARHTVQGF